MICVRRTVATEAAARYGVRASRRRTRTWRVRVAVRIVISVLAVLAAAPLASASVRKSSPGLSKVKWRLVLRSGLEVDF